MTCPKCRARIGISRQHFGTVFGQTTGMSCFICGYWVQEYPAGKQHGGLSSPPSRIALR
jgi:hypothetical protein